MFEVSLEVLNRRSVRNVNKKLDNISEIAEYFFEKIGKANVKCHLCVQCKDYDKDNNSTDDYYMNLMEIARERTILCTGCMRDVIYEHVVGSEEEICSELKQLRIKQPNGVNVDPFLVSCGY